MTKTHLFFLFTWLFPLFAFCDGILIEQMGEASIIGKSGEVVNIAYRLSNLTDKALQVDPELTLPDGWEIISNNTSVSIPSHQSVLKIVSIHIPSGAWGGQYAIDFKATSIYNKDIFGEISTTIEIRDLVQLQIEPAAVPEFVIAGESVKASFVLHNLGNAKSDFWLFSENCQVQEESTVSLAPGETILFDVVAKTMATVRNEGKVFMKIKSGQKGSETILAYSSAFVRVIPRIQTKSDKGHLLPVMARVSHVTRKWQNGETATGLQGEIYASGSLKGEGNDRFEMRLRGPDRFGVSVLGQYDEYYAHYENRNWMLHIGDKSYSLSLLTDFARYGRGVEASKKVGGGKYELGGYFQNPRFFPGLRQVAAGYLKYKPQEDVTVAFNGMHKIYSNEKGQAALGSITAKWNTIANTTLESEISSGLSSGLGLGKAFMLRANSNPTKKLLLAANYIYADKNHPGYYSNTNSIYGQVNYRVTKLLGVNVLINQDERNASKDTLFAIAPFSRLAQAGVFYDWKNGLSARAYLRLNEMEDRMPSLKFHYKEKLVRLQLEKNWRKLQLTVTNEFGKRESFLGDPENRFSNANRLFFNGNYRLSQRFGISALAQYYWHSRFGGSLSRQWIWGGNVHAELFPFSQLNLSFQTNYQLEEYHRNRNLFDLRFSQLFGKNRDHELSVSANYALLQRTEDQKDLSVQTSYTYHFGIRTGKKKMSQGIYGQLTNKGAASVVGVSFLLNGQRAVTDETGHFKFEDVPPGKYYLMLDPSSVALHELTDEPVPIEMEVKQGVDVFLELGLTKSVSISGAIDIEPVSRSTSHFNKEEQPKLFMLEISNGKETYRRVANKSHYFEFPDVRPGQWKLRVINPDGYKGFYFKRSEWDLDIPPGGHEEMEIKLHRKRKKIKFQQKLSLTSAGQ